MEQALRGLQAWYQEQCNGDWEHQYGVKIETLDNPGWDVSIDLHGTRMVTVRFEEVHIERSETDWVRCRVRDATFEGFGGPSNLVEVLELFLKWVALS